jgi:hypothetical protein
LTLSGTWPNIDRQTSEQKKGTTSIYLAQLQKEVGKTFIIKSPSE